MIVLYYHSTKWQNDFSNALIAYQYLHDICKKRFGPDHIQLVTILSNMAFMKFKLKEYESAFQLYQDTLRIQQMSSSKHVDICLSMSTTLHSMGLVASAKRIPYVAIEYFHKSLHIRRQHLGCDHVDLIPILCNIGSIHVRMLGSDVEGARLYKEALRIGTKSSDPIDRSRVKILQKLGIIYQRMGEWSDAIQNFTEAIHILLDWYNVDKCFRIAQDIATLYYLIGTVHLQQRNQCDMLQGYVQALRWQSNTTNNSNQNLNSDRNIFESASIIIDVTYTLQSISALYPPCAATG
jgi:tetratricopeptide (TPR) repeat protein